jgi:hypothetical protein
MNVANFSPDRVYRYDLWRTWSFGSSFALFVGLNPSTADETQDDPTIRRCVAFAKAWGYSGLCMVNLFAFRATKPEDMKRAADPIGPQNDYVLWERAGRANIVIAAWGAHGSYRGRAADVRRQLPNLHYLRLTKDGSPGHPLYLPKTLVPQPWAY